MRASGAARGSSPDFCFPDWVYQKIEAAGIRLQS
jgi:hypothetical protein